MTLQNVWSGFKFEIMSLFKIILFAGAFVISIALIINKYRKDRIKPTIYSLLLPLLFVLLIIKNLKEL